MMTTIAEVTHPSAVRVRARHSFDATRMFSNLDRAKERHLYRQKWFDYRFISPLEATIRFRLVYQDIFRWKYSTNFDTLEADQKTGVGRKGTRAGVTSSWRARQFADELGVTYEIFLEAAFQVCIRRGWTRLPHMNQLYGNKNRDAIASAVKSLWADHISLRFTVSLLPTFREESFCGLNAQIDHRRWVMDQIKARHGSPNSIGKACYIHRVLPEVEALLEYGQDRLDQAKAEIVFDGLVPDEPIPAETPFPSCFGLPGAHDVDGHECDECPVFRRCFNLEKIVRNAAAKKFGSDDPVLSRRKAQGRRRTSKFRAKEARQAQVLGREVSKPG